jgi:glucose/arabinose dehydrogenase
MVLQRFCFAILVFLSVPSMAAVDLGKIKLPAGFKISVYASDVKGAREMAWGKDGTLFVGTRETPGNVYAVTKDRKVHVIAHGLNMPNGVAYRDGSLYVAEVNKITRFEGIDAKLEHPPQPIVVTSDLPSEKHHGWKYIAFGPDGKLYVPVGAPCNICEVKDPHGTLLSMDADGKNRAVYARGIRNTVGFDWHPLTHELWFTDNGCDMLGDDQPPDELNRATKAGLHFGYPFCHGGEILDPELGGKHNCADYVAPVQKMPAHVANLGMKFYTGSMFPAEYKNQIFIAEHGSWNRSKKIGYRLTLVFLDKDGKAIKYEPFAQGWLKEEKNWGRPVDILQAPDGALLVSDDTAGVIYRISYEK